jgi:hypothetical protein
MLETGVDREKPVKEIKLFLQQAAEAYRVVRH